MKRLLCLILVVILLSGCGSSSELDRALALREKLLKCSTCTFDAIITADYSDKLYTFGMSCRMDQSGDMAFEVTAPQSIAGITGSVSNKGGTLTFDGQVLAFELLADGQVTPVSAPWLLLRTLRGGYLSACAPTENGLRISVDDSYEEDALQLEIWLNEGDLPTQAEILWQGKRIVTLCVENFLYE